MKIIKLIVIITLDDDIVVFLKANENEAITVY